LNKVEVVFGENAAAIKQWSKDAAEAFGMSRQKALEAAGTFGNLFRALGLGTPQASDMSKKLVQLAADLASFNNANPEEVLLALRSGLVGEAEPLRKFGVVRDGTLDLSDRQAAAPTARMAPVRLADAETLGHRHAGQPLFTLPFDQVGQNVVAAHGASLTPEL